MAIDRTVPSQAPFAYRAQTIEMVSDSDPRITYQLQLPSCTCPDWRYRRAGTAELCKHLSAAVAAGLGGWVDPNAAPETAVA